MLYDKEAKIRTAGILKTLRENINGDPTKKKRSHAKLYKELIKKYGENNYAIPAARTLMNYENIDEETSKFKSGFSMKAQTLVLLADFYGVSCDYLLGMKQIDYAESTELGYNLGLDKESIDILYNLKNPPEKRSFHSDFTFDDLILIINEFIHSFDDKLPNTSKETDSMLFKKGYLNKLSRYLLYKSLPGQYALGYIETETSVFESEYFKFDEEKIDAILLMELQQMLKQTKEKFEPISNTKAEAQKEALENINSKKKEVKND